MFDIFRLLDFLKKQITKKDLVILALLLSLFLFTRLVNIEKLPIFTDEGIYIQWAKTAWHDASWRFISLTDGRQPLQTWLTIPLLKIFPNNALLAGRIFGVISGFFAVNGLLMLLWYLFGKKTAFFGVFFFLITPYFTLYDRMALMDSGINAAFIWILFFSILLVRTIRLDIAIIFGLISGLSLLAKSSVQLFLGLAAGAPILVYQKPLRKFFRHLINYFLLYAILIFLAFAIYNIQRLSPFMHFIDQKNSTFILTFDELIKNPLGSFQFNIWSMAYYVLYETGIVVSLSGFIGLFLLLKKDKRLALYLLAWLFISYISISFVAKVLYPRYITFFATLTIIGAAYLLVLLKNKKIYAFYIGLIVISVIYQNYTILFDYKNIPLPEIDRGQYIVGGSSGYGIKEIIEYSRKQTEQKPVTILAEGNFGMAGDVLNVFINKNDNIFVKSYWPLESKNLYENLPELKTRKVFVVYVYKKELPPELPLKLIKKFEKPEGKSAIHFFELVK
ncbi:MAG: hypothetical protein US11_C0002G0024 [Candidatus Roizmanbacteria bacterium GW2011_GWA2_36_23]|uniref:Uncharacterized protein n=1 Tax=Candidatus Roizmanbacteria bacterium GW2011_GWA2_36_23 TaxID=1618480 RepID=A0A0G0ELK2_9BACT|nr:MAG: hypothetical protein US11_C0002G0024 [Candidatus Roizmanbacteria bacterium GW2011_GWA2_36_23]